VQLTRNGKWGKKIKSQGGIGKRSKRKTKSKGGSLCARITRSGKQQKKKKKKVKKTKWKMKNEKKKNKQNDTKGMQNENKNKL
jgi:hypothetical protein